MLRIGFIFPSSSYLHDPFRGDPHTHFQLLTLLEERLGDQVEVRLIDLRGIDHQWAIYHMPECDVYLQSVYTLDAEEQQSIVQALRDRYPDALHVAGGPHITEFPEESLTVFDCLIIGEGEELILRAIGDIQKKALKPIYKQEWPVDVNHYPFPRRHFLPQSAIARKDLLTLKKDPSFKAITGTTAIFSRGCPYQCSFCAMPKTRVHKGVRYRAPELITEEINYLKTEFGIEGISLLDEIGIPLKQKEAVAHLEAIGQADIVWRGQCRVDGIGPDIAALARASGCVALGLGVESAWQPSLDAINKCIEVTRAKQTIRLLKANGIEVRLYMIFGLPGEPPDIVERTWEFVQETDPDLVVLSLFTVRPGTAVYNEPRKFGIKSIHGDWSNTRHMHGRYDPEVPSLTFEYETTTPWGKSLSTDQIVNNYVEFQNRLREHGLSTL
jgi:anaerobic magnesium-protoporphyrin IX monomethyl ester cyclase